MGFWDLLSSTNQTLKYGYAAVNKVTNVVRVVGAQKVEEYLSDPQARENIGPIEREKMGFWDLLSSTNQTLKYGYAAVNKVANVVRVVGAQKVEEYLSDPQAREKIGPIEREKMGFWDLLSSPNQTLKYGYAAVNKVANVVRVDGAQKVEEYLSDPQARENIGRIATNVAGVVVPEILKSVPGLSRKTIPREERGSEEGEREKMGFWDLLYCTNDKIKQNAPDIMAVKNACRSSCNLGYAAVKKVDNVIRVDGAQKVKEYLPDPQAREKIGRIATNVAGVVVPEILKSVPGGVQIYRIVRDGLTDRPPYNHGSEKSNSKEMMEEMQKKMDKIQEEISNINYHNRILLERIKQYESPNER